RQTPETAPTVEARPTPAVPPAADETPSPKEAQKPSTPVQRQPEPPQTTEVPPTETTEALKPGEPQEPAAPEAIQPAPAPEFQPATPEPVPAEPGPEAPQAFDVSSREAGQPAPTGEERAGQPESPVDAKPATPAVQRQPEPAAPVDAERPAQPPEVDEAESRPVPREVPPAIETGQPWPETIDDDQDTVIAPLPLEAVWPVEKKKPRPPAAPKPAKPTVQRKTSGGETVGEDVHEAIKDVMPGQYTDSAIELITPRRPRPAARPPKVSRQADEEPPDEGPVQSLDEGPGLTAKEPAAPAAIDRSPVEAATEQRAPSEPRMIQTEIGALPSDLWRLMGEQPPAPRPGPPAPQSRPTTTQRKATDARLDAAARAAESQTMVAEPSGLVTQFFGPPVIQRVEEETRPSEQSDDTGAEGEQPQEDGLTLDHLARLILPEIKRRLAIDNERSRGRFGR
ncbi:MAG: hypothetical protein PVH18_02565, partial [Chloroflexota bacterium]